MTTTRVLATALPYSLRPDAPFHLSVFLSHRLTPETPGATLADFPAAEHWVKTLRAGTLDLVTDTAPDGIPVRWVSVPDDAAWVAVLPADTPVAGFPTPDVTAEPWRTFPAHAMDAHAVETHLASTLVSPLTPPRVVGNAVAEAVLGEFLQVYPAVRELRSFPGRLAERDADILRRKLAEAAATLGSRSDDTPGPLPWTSPVEVLLADREGEEQLTRYLDSLQDVAVDEPVRVALRDVHAARRFYQREGRRGIASGAAPPPEVPVQDFHERAASFGSTPALLRRLGLVLDVAVDAEEHRKLLATATWVSARFTPAEGSDVVRLAPPRTWCESRGGQFRAVSSRAWSGGALPVGDPRTYTILDLDPDASALKLEQHVRDLPRALASELNGDRASGAPATLRSTGFSLARIGRDRALEAQVARAQGFAAVDDNGVTPGPDLAYDDVVRGVRLEVWDDGSGRWHSVHERRVSVVAGGVPVLDDAADTGFLQLTGLTRAESGPYHLHEVFVGWDGWSLSAPRPGKVAVLDEDGEEAVVDGPPGDPASHVEVRTRVAPGTLPRLRYGRRYSFRVCGVDLAGNSVPRVATGGRPAAGVLAAAQEQLRLLRGTYEERDRTGLLGALREEVLRGLPLNAGSDDGALLETPGDLAAAQDRAVRAARPGEPRLPAEALTGEPDVDALLRRRLAEAAEQRRAADGGPGTREVAAALARLARSREVWRARPNLELEPEDLARLEPVAEPSGDRRLPPGLPDPLPGPELPVVVTTPRPFLRWHPVPAPTLVARRPLGVGESLQRLVVRDDAPTERHVVPPKTTQLEAEQHGAFDDAIGTSDPADHDRALAVALRERGTLLDEWVQDLTDPLGRVHQDGIALHSRPGADPAAAVTLEQITERRDTPLGEGQYVVHDTDQLRLPYLPDPLARGAALVFYDAGAPHTLREPRVVQTVVLRYAGEWPEVEPLRLVVEPGGELGAHRVGNRVVVTVPPGEQVRVAMSSALDETDLAVLGLWRAHLASVPGTDDEDAPARAVLARAAANGWFWWLTPAADLRLVHAVRRPVRPPELEALRVGVRVPDLTAVGLVGVVDVHGPSTERLVLEAAWEEWVDDVTTGAPVRVRRQDVVLSSPVQPDERYGLLHLVDAVLGGQDGTVPVVSHRAIQTFPDTHHRRVTYTPRGLTRYAEFFPPEELPAPDDPALAGAPRELTVVSAARPAAPDVRDVVPLLLWEETTEPDQPFALRRTRRSGARVWLGRPWYSSGDGELLAVVVSTDADLPPTVASRWAKDPVQATGVPGSTMLPPLVDPAELLVNTTAGAVVEPRPGRPVTNLRPVRLVDVAGEPVVLVLGYQPEYHPGRGEWFVDVAMDPGESLWPFVRLAVARYQPDSLPDRELSPVVTADWVQPLPERVATVSRRTEETVRVTVTGAFGLTRLRTPDADGSTDAADAVLRLSRELFVTVQEAPADAAADLEWVDHARVRLPLVGVAGVRATWSGEVELPEPLPLATPGTSTRFRVLVEEYEYFDADPLDGPKTGEPSRAERLVYADHVPL